LDQQGPALNRKLLIKAKRLAPQPRVRIDECVDPLALLCHAYLACAFFRAKSPVARSSQNDA